MKTLLALVLTICGCGANAASVFFQWDASPETNIVHYEVHYGVQSGVYTTVIITTNLSLWVTNLPTSTLYYFSIKAVNANGDKSTLLPAVQGWTPVAPPRNFRFVTNSLQGAVSPSGPWQNLAIQAVQVPTSNGLAFYRSHVSIER